MIIQKSVAAPFVSKDLVFDGKNNEMQSDSESASLGSIPLEVKVTTRKEISRPEPGQTEADLFSPFTERLMRNLDKVCDDKYDVSTPKGEIRSERPWERDRLLGRVGSRSGEPKAMDKCSCSASLFSGNDEMIEFFLPLMGTGCTCEKKTSGLVNPEEPTSLVNILRPWQVKFLSGFGIYKGEELVKAFHRSASALANALRQYRKKEGMTPFRTKSCGMALQIWSKTCKAFVRSIRNQLKAAKKGSTESPPQRRRSTQLKVPNTLYILSSFLENMPH